MGRMRAPSVQLRLAGAPDALAMAQMSRDLIETGLGWSYDAPKVARMIAHADNVALVACDANGLAGFAVMQFGDERGHLVLLAVQPRNQRQGVARRLLTWLVDSARVAGIAELRLELRAGNAGARAFYRAMGFDDAGLLPGYYLQREPALRMLRVLRSPGEAATTWQAPTLRRS
jgi:ribosomal-protein-alanine N-acetyltransferase